MKHALGIENALKTSVEKTQQKRSLVRPRLRMENNIKMYVSGRRSVCCGLGCTGLYLSLMVSLWQHVSYKQEISFTTYQGVS